LAVALESAALVEMEDRAAELVQREGRVEAARTEEIGIETLQRLPRRGVGGHQPMPDERRHQLLATIEITVAAATLLPRHAARDREGRSALRVAAIREDADPDPANGAGLFAAVQIEHAPAERVGADVDSDSVRRTHGDSSPLFYSQCEQKIDRETGGLRY